MKVMALLAALLMVGCSSSPAPSPPDTVVAVRLVCQRRESSFSIDAPAAYVPDAGPRCAKTVNRDVHYEVTMKTAQGSAYTVNVIWPATPEPQVGKEWPPK